MGISFLIREYRVRKFYSWQKCVTVIESYFRMVLDMIFVSFYSFHQHSKLKRVKSYGDGIYYNDQKELFSHDGYNKENVPGRSSHSSHAFHSNCLSCQKQLQEEYDRSSCFQPQSLNFEEQESSLSMLLWDQNHQKSIGPTYDSIPTANDSKQRIGNSFCYICYI